jgi:hypothetical protein
MGIKGFSKEQRNLTVTQVIEDTLEVEADGSVTFRARRGKGSGRPVEIAGDQFDTFVELMNDIASRRESLAKEAKSVTEDNGEADSE